MEQKSLGHGGCDQRIGKGSCPVAVSHFSENALRLKIYRIAHRRAGL
jgi:hypothetical protein